MLDLTCIFLLVVLLSARAQAADYPYGFCKAKGQNGVCIAVSACAGGGDRTAGLCPGDSTIQCCTYGSCSRSGKTGTCESTSTCKGTR